MDPIIPAIAYRNPKEDIPILKALSCYVSYNELKRLRLVCQAYDDVIRVHPRFLNGTGKFLSYFAMWLNPLDRNTMPQWKSIQCSLYRLERCNFIRECWNTRIKNNLKKLELYRVSQRCQQLTKFIGNCPLLEELSLNRVHIKVTTIDPPQEGNLLQYQYCSHNEPLNMAGIFPNQTIRKVKIVQLPIIPRCLLMLLRIRCQGVLEEYEYSDNHLERHRLMQAIPDKTEQIHRVKTILRENVATLRKLTWNNCPVDGLEFLQTLNRQFIPDLNLTEVSIGQSKSWGRNCSINNILGFLDRPQFRQQVAGVGGGLSKLSLELWEGSLSQRNIRSIYNSLLWFQGTLTSISLIINHVNEQNIVFDIEPNLFPQLRHFEMKHPIIPIQMNNHNRISVANLLSNDHLPVNLESLVLQGVLGVTKGNMRDFLLAPRGHVQLKKLYLDHVNINQRNCLDDETVQLIIRWFPLLEDLSLIDSSKLTDYAFTGIPKETCDIIIRAKSYHLLAKAELQLSTGSRQLSELIHLRKLNISGCTAVTDVSIFRGFKFGFLREINLSHTYVSDIGIRMLYVNCPGIESIELKNCPCISRMGLCLFMKYSCIQKVVLTRSVWDRCYPGVDYKVPIAVRDRGIQIKVCPK